jgi:antitoxin (DNA-binding transcriptional repressor) of toxin-antitoxin stability system/DNA-binding XRE family transcriptional regulator
MAKKKPGRAHWSRAISHLMASNITLRTQTALAQASGVAQSTIGRILRGTVDPQSDNVERLASAFGLTYSALAALAEADASAPVPARGAPANGPQRGVPCPVAPWEMVIYNDEMDISVTDFKAHCLDLSRKVEERGETITIRRRGRVVARLEPANGGSSDGRPWEQLRALGGRAGLAAQESVWAEEDFEALR